MVPFSIIFVGEFCVTIYRKAGDFTVIGLSAEEARQRILENADLLPHPIRMEANVTWLHIDVLPQWGVKEKVYFFNE